MKKHYPTFVEPEHYPAFVEPTPAANPCGGCPPEPAASRIVDPSRLEALRNVLANPGRAPEGEGDGIIYVGGGKYWPGVAVGCRMIRELGCQWPIEVWYRGSCEAVYKDDVAGLGVELIDADAMSARLNDNLVPRGNCDLGGWEAKSYAFTHTTLNRFLYLDADAYCVASPCRLFSLLDRRPFVFWSDFDSQRISINWEKVLPEAAGVGDHLPPVQGGQLLIDRRAAWPLIATAHEICQNSDYYWPHPHNKDTRLMYGDQDAWRVGLADGACSWLHLGKAKWDRVAFVCELDGKPRIVHRCQAKLFGPEHARKEQENKPHPHLPYEGKVFDILADVFNRRQPGATKVFREIYRRELWTTGSGAGSSDREAEPYVKIVNKLARQRGWDSCIDAGCGDGRVGAKLAMGVVGVDIVDLPNVVHIADLYRDLERIPKADVFLCKDVLMHWPNEMLRDFLPRLQKLIDAGHWKSAILTQDSYQYHDGQNTYLGGYRGLNPSFAPLNEFGLSRVADYLHKSVLEMRPTV